MQTQNASQNQQMTQLLEQMSSLRVENNHIRQLVDDQKLRFPSNIKEVFDLAILHLSESQQTPTTTQRVNTWTNARRNLDIYSSIKQAFEEASNPISEEEARMMKFASIIKNSIKPERKLNEKEIKLTHCSKCGRDGHTTKNCFANTHADGSKLH